MRDSIVTATIIFLSFFFVFIGIGFIRSGKKLLKGEKLNDDESKHWEELFFDYHILKSIFGERKARGYDRIWFGIVSVIFGIGLLLMFAFAGVIF